MKTLKSAYHKQKYIIMGPKNKRFEIESLEVKDLWASVPISKIHRGYVFYENVKKDIQKNGLRFPIMVIKSNRAHLVQQKNIWGDKILPLPFDPQAGWLSTPINVVWGGSQRLNIAMELGYTHIDCAIMSSYQEAHELQKCMRAPFPHLYNGDPA
jgi:hypothetical protein